MNEELPSQMPPRPPPPTAVVTRMPRTFGVFGTLVYLGASITALTSMIAYGFGWNPPWFIILSCIFYTGVSSGIIAMGRMQANRDAHFFIQALRPRSAENQRAMRRMN
jgi:hypothetical protein